MKRINPIYLLIALNIVVIFFRDFFVSEETSAAIGAAIEATLLDLGVLGYLGIALAYAVCGFFFVPLLIPLNILGGALYGPYEGTVLALVGVTLGTITSIVSVRHVFTGMQKSIEGRPRIQRLLARADQHRNLVIVIMRFTVVIPYLVQNIALAATNSSLARITIVTTISCAPGAAIYSFLGAGLVRADQATELLLYIALPILLLLFISAGMIYINRKYEED